MRLAFISGPITLQSAASQPNSKTSLLLEPLLPSITDAAALPNTLPFKRSKSLLLSPSTSQQAAAPSPLVGDRLTGRLLTLISAAFDQHADHEAGSVHG